MFCILRLMLSIDIVIKGSISVDLNERTMRMRTRQNEADVDVGERLKWLE